MDEVFARKNLIKPGRLHALSSRSNLAGALQLGSHFAAIIATGTALWMTWGTWWAVPLFIVHGVILNFLYAGQHELSHWTVFKTRRLNEIFGRLVGFIMIYPRDFDQIQHTAHHRHTQDWDKDGELTRDRYTLFSYLMWFFGPTYWYSRIARIIRMSLGRVIEPYIPQERRADVILEARLHLAGYALIAALSVYFQSWAAVILWLAPLLTTKFVHQMQNTIEHLGLTHEQNILKNTRTTRTNFVLRWVCWNMQYHTAHHAFPGVPFYKLAQLHKEIFEANGLKPYSMTYLAFQRQVWKALSGGKTEASYPDDRAWIGDAQEVPPAKVAVNA